MSKWLTTKLGDVLQPVKREEKVDATKEYRLLGIRLEGQGPFPRETVLGTQTSAGKLFRVATGDFIYSRLFACRGAFGVITEELDGCYVSGEFPTFVPVPGKVDVEFLKYWFRLASVIATVDADCSGSTPLTRNRFKENFFLGLEILMPPLPEQRRVVARIEELAAQMQEARALRHQAAEEAEALFPAIKTDAYNNAVRIAGGTERLEFLCNRVTDGTHVTPRYLEDGVPFISVKDITSGIMRFDSCRRISPEQHTELTKRCRPERDDVLLTKVGTIGYAKVIDVDTEFSIFVSLALLKLKKERVLPRFMEHMLTSTTIRDKALADTRGVGNQNLVLKFIKDFPIPAPPLPEQRRIVAELDALQAEVDALKRLQAETATELDALLPSILDKAFKGQL